MFGVMRGPGVIPSDRQNPFGIPQLPESDFGPQIQMPQAKPRAGMFGSGKANIGEILSAAISGYLAAGGNPAGQMGLQALHQRRQLAQQQELASQQRENDFQDFIRKESWKLANPGAVNNDTVADYNFRVQTLGKPAADEWLRNPPQFMNIPGVGIVQMPRMGGPQAAPTAPVGKLTPLDEGGPMPSASGGFQPSGY